MTETYTKCCNCPEGNCSDRKVQKTATSDEKNLKRELEEDPANAIRTLFRNPEKLAKLSASKIDKLTDE